MASTPEEAYRQASLEGASSLQRLLQVYSIAIEGGVNRDSTIMLRALALLRKTLDYSAGPEIALSLERLYRQCEHHIAGDDFGQATEILEHLRSLWIGGES